MPANPDTTPNFDVFWQQANSIQSSASSSWANHVIGMDLGAIEGLAQEANEAMHVDGVGIDGAVWNSPASIKATEELRKANSTYIYP